MNDRGLAYALIAPTLAVLLGLLGWPLVEAIILSFYDVNPLTRVARPVGLANYADVLAGEEFWGAVRTNFVWLGGSLAVQIVAGVGFALLLNQKFPGRSFARACLLFPYLMPTVVAALLWQWMFNDLYGVINALCIALGIAPLDWLGSMPAAMISVILVGSWKVLPFVVLAVLARLQSIPQQLYEAAMVDGASAWGRFWDVTLPQLRGVLVVVILLRAIWDFKEFDLIFLLTGGGPVTATTTLPLLVYKEAFQLLHMGRASAIAVAMFVIMILIIAAYFLSLRNSQAEADAL